MSGGIAYIWDPDKTFRSRCNLDMVELEPVVSHAEQVEAKQLATWHSLVRGGQRETDETILRRLIEDHYRYTGSFRSRDLLNDWQQARGAFVKIMPIEYRRALGEIWRATHPEQIAA
jgi:glutamate synthase (NADPH/NADH) large chain